MKHNNSSIIETAQSLATNWESDPIFIDRWEMYAIQLVFTGTLTGTFKLQYSNDTGVETTDHSEPVAVGIDDSAWNWTDVADSSSAVSAAGNILYEDMSSACRWVKVVWTAGSGSGSLTVARINLKSSK